MKTKIRLAAAAIVISLACAYITVPAAANALPEKGDKIHGFTVTQRHPYELMGAELITFEHDKTGAYVIFCANDDINREFQISFKTPAFDDSGITHIFEHSTLGGSSKYPSSTLFMKVMNQTYNTYMNAVTSQNVTSYPLSSLSEEQLLKLSDYYLDSVFNPMIYEDSSVFDREAWRYELASAGDDLTVSGTVFSEMQGNSDITTDSFYNVRRTLFPDSYCANKSGGVPEEMLNLDNDDLIEYHKKYYHPSNSLTILYGALDCNAFLSLLDEYFSHYTRSNEEVDFDSYTSTSDYIRESYEYPAPSSVGEGMNSCISYTLECSGAGDNPDDLAMLNLAANVWAGLVEESAQKTMPQILVSCNFDIDTPEPLIIFTATASDIKLADRFALLVDTAARQIVRNGISDSLLDSISLSARRSRVQALDSSFGSSGIEAASMWAVTDKPDYFFEYLESALSTDDITSGDIVSILEKYITNSRTALVTTVSMPGLADVKEAEFKKKLADTKSAMSDSEIDALTEKTFDYHNPTSDNAELDRMLLSEISVINAHNLPEETSEYNITDEISDGVRYVSSTADVSSMGKGRIMLDASDIPVEDLGWFSFYVSLIGMIDTEKYRSEQLMTLASQYADSGIDIVTLRSDNENGFTPYLIFNYEGFSEDSKMIFDIAEQALLKPDFNDTAAIKALAAQYRSTMASAVDTNGSAMLRQHILASSELHQAYFNAIGISLDSNIENVISTVETDMDLTLSKLKEIQSLLVNKRGALVVYSGSDDSIAKNRTAAENFFSLLPDKEKKYVDYTRLKTQYEDSALIMNSSVNYNGVYAPASILDLKYNGSMEVALNCIKDKVLFPTLRDGFNAYSVSCSFTDSGLMMYSYRDPELSNTFKVYSTLSELINSSDITQDEIDRYIVSVYSDYVKPNGKLYDAYTAAVDYTKGITPEIKLDYMHGIKSATPETVKQMSEVFQRLYENGILFTAGSAEAIGQNHNLYDNIIDPLGYGDVIKIIVNGNMIQSSAPAYIENDRIMLPMRSVFEALGADVKWDGESRRVTAKKDGITIVLTIDADVIEVTNADGNKTEVRIDSPAVIRNDYTMVPLRAVSETLGYDVEWDGDTKTVYVE